MYRIEIITGYFIVTKRLIGVSDTIRGAARLHRAARYAVLASHASARVSVSRNGSALPWEVLRSIRGAA